MEQKIKINAENEWASQIKKKMVRSFSFSHQSCIFRVPTLLHRYNGHLFKPNLVSIGPYHRDEPELQPMQEIKLWYLNCLIDRAPTPETSLECFTRSFMENVSHCIECYEERVEISTEEFVKMMVIDGCFIIEYFRKHAKLVPRSPYDPLFRMSWIHKALIVDLLLLENQLPWFVLECLFKLTNKADNNKNLSLPQLTHKYFYWDTLRMEPISKLDSGMENKHLLDLQRNILLSGFEDRNNKGCFVSTPCVTELLQAGIKFEVEKGNHLMKIKFENGVLKIPSIVVLDNAESFFRNLIAYEQCDCSLNDTISSYVGFLDNLINSSKDVDHLRKKEIITCFLSTEDVSGFFRRLYNDADIVNSPYERIAKEINAYCKSRWPRWRAILSRDYFSSPWSIISLFAAVIILVLTFLQTVYTILYA